MECRSLVTTDTDNDITSLYKRDLVRCYLMFEESAIGAVWESSRSMTTPVQVQTSLDATVGWRHHTLAKRV